MMRADMMKNRRTAWTNIAVITPPASLNALGMFSKPAPSAAFTIRKTEPSVEDPSLDCISGRSSVLSPSSRPSVELVSSDLLPSNSLVESGSLLLELDRIELGESSLENTLPCEVWLGVRNRLCTTFVNEEVDPRSESLVW